MTQGDDFQEIIDKIVRLRELKEQLLAGKLSPEGAWIHEYTVRRRYPRGFVGEYRYAKWQAENPIFKRNPKKRALPLKPGKDSEYTNHQHIGRVWSNTSLGMEPEVEQAYQAFDNRRQLEKIDAVLREIQLILASFKIPDTTGEEEPADRATEP